VLLNGGLHLLVRRERMDGDEGFHVGKGGG
jgi:hypothetical protein